MKNIIFYLTNVKSEIFKIFYVGFIRLQTYIKSLVVLSTFKWC